MPLKLYIVVSGETKEQCLAALTGLNPIRGGGELTEGSDIRERQRRPSGWSLEYYWSRNPRAPDLVQIKDGFVHLE